MSKIKLFGIGGSPLVGGNSGLNKDFRFNRDMGGFAGFFVLKVRQRAQPVNPYLAPNPHMVSVLVRACGN